MKQFLSVALLSLCVVPTAFADEFLGQCKTSEDNTNVILEEIQGYNSSEGDFFRITISHSYGPEYFRFQLKKSKNTNTEKAFSISDGEGFFTLNKLTGMAEYKFKAVVWECWPGLGEWCVSKVPKWKTENVGMKDCSFSR